METKERIKNMIKDEVPDGYRKIGSNIIPRDWYCEKISKLVTLISGQHIEVKEYNTLGDGIPYLTGPADFNERVITKSKYTKKPKVMCQNGDILIAVKGSGVGKTIISDGEYCISRQLMAIRGPKHILEMLYHNLKLNETIYKTDSVGLIPGINRSDILNKKIPLPRNDEEVTKIVTILSTWDKAIELKEQLIEEKKQQKKGLMKKLLTGKVRLPGFEGEWEYIQARKLFQNISDKGHNGLGHVLSANQERGIILRTEGNIDIKYDKNNLKNYKKVRPGEFVISLRSFQGGIEYSKYEGLLSPAYTIIRNIVPIDDSFYKHFFKSTDFITRLNGMIYGIRDGKQISFKDFAVLKLPYTTLEEQIAIGKVLECSSVEIGLLEQELAALKLQKKGLMQLLLTGIVRVQC
ncbi:restriction endonuclease subunit S [Acetobacterium wieringae]|uniref:Restriction endonuclease subunit S n=1 Tax=Acetobacterium wieringae TaxID=52694 RepID=A0A5D0WIW1_9FIRM|nr:restriction endonuclease subunit S [Acetobacterium wieringae]TYC84182.1 restriction endonuclease subunit S [Acetobacterium wieringae]